MQLVYIMNKVPTHYISKAALISAAEYGRGVTEYLAIVLISLGDWESKGEYI
jgi:hypothetical protein